MKKLLLVFLIAASLQAAETGLDYRGWPKDFRLMYVVGFLDGEMTGKFATLFTIDKAITETTRKKIGDDMEAAKARGEKHDPAAGCIDDPKLVSGIEAVRDILDNYIAEHPEELTKPIRVLAERAFIDACKKRAKNP